MTKVTWLCFCLHVANELIKCTKAEIYFLFTVFSWADNAVWFCWCFTSQLRIGLILQYSRLKRTKAQPIGELIKIPALCSLDCLVNLRRNNAVLVSLMLGGWTLETQVQWFRKLWGRGQKSRKGAKKREDKKTLRTDTLLSVPSGSVSSYRKAHRLIAFARMKEFKAVDKREATGSLDVLSHWSPS